MGRIIVEVMPKPEILDPQGKAVSSALPRIGITNFSEVRQGKCFHLSAEGPITEELVAQARVAAEEVLSNPIIEDVVRVQAVDDNEAEAPDMLNDRDRENAEAVAKRDIASAEAVNASETDTENSK